MAEASARQPRQAGARRRGKVHPPRDKRVTIRLTDGEYAELAAAAGREGMADAAYLAFAALAHTRNLSGIPAGPLRTALIQLMRESELMQAVAADFRRLAEDGSREGTRNGVDAELFRDGVERCMEAIPVLTDAARRVRWRLQRETRLL